MKIVFCSFHQLEDTVKKLKASASMTEYTGPTSCGVWCFGLSCGCSSFEACVEDEYDLGKPQSSSHFDHRESTTSGVFIGEMAVGRHRKKSDPLDQGHVSTDLTDPNL